MRMFRMASGTLVSALFIGNLVQVFAQPIIQHRFPDAKPGQLWISSIPTGLPAYVARAGTRSLDEVFVPSNRKGVTPVLVDLEPGSYEVGFVLPKGTSQPDAELAPRFAGFLGHAVDSDAGVHRVVYTGVRKNERAASFIGLAFKNDLPDADVASLYPPGQNFSIDETQVRDAIGGRGIDSGEIGRGIELLRRGGKVLLRSGSRTTLELKIDGNLEVVPAKR